MPSKAAPNGFYMYMQAQQKKIKEQSGRTYTMSELPTICRESWKNMSVDEKKSYDVLAKQEKQRRNVGNRGWAKMDTHRQIIAERRDPVKEEKRRRDQETRLMLNSWAGRDVRDITFYIIDFQVMYDDLLEDFHLPMEIGLVSITLREGILNYMHRFVNPGDPPTGNRRIAQEFGEQTHQIPLNFKDADSNFEGLCDQMKSFLVHDAQSNDVPPVYCLSTHRQQVENCLDFIYDRAKVMPFLNKLFCLEDLVSTLITSTGTKEVPQTQVYDVLIQNRWDYVSNIRCSYHNECDCSYCSLSIVRRYSFAIFDILSSLLDFKLTRGHFPDEAEISYLIKDLGGATSEPERGPRQSRSRSDRDSFSSQESAPYRPAGRGRGQAVSLQMATKGIEEIRLSDDSNDEDEGIKRKNDDVDAVDDDDDGSEDEDVETQPQYTLRELRKPKSSSMTVGSSSEPTVPMAANNWNSNTAGFATAMPSTRPWGVQMAGVRPMGPGFVNPPPGFRGRSLGPQPVIPPAAPAWPALSRQNPGAVGGAPPRPMGRGFSSARGRGFASKQ